MVNGGAAPGFKRRDVEFQVHVLTPLVCAGRRAAVHQAPGCASQSDFWEAKRHQTPVLSVS